MLKLSPVIQRVSPLADVALQGRFGADKGAPGVRDPSDHDATAHR